MRLHDSTVILGVERENGMLRFCFQDVLELPRLATTGELVCFLDVTDQGKLELAHVRTDHVSEIVLIEGFRHGIFTATGLEQKRLRQKLKACVCKWCAQAKITKRSFGAKEHVLS